MKNKCIMKNGIAMLLTAALVFGLAPSIQDIGVARAEPTGVRLEGTGDDNTSGAVSTVTKPSVTAYATSKELETEFKPDEGTKAVGKLKFGKDEGGNAQKWYILGKDDGFTIDNTAIFADSNIINSDIEYNYAFYGQDGYSAYSGGRKVEELATYADKDKPTGGVNWNHYAVSDLKDKLQKMSTDTGYFSEVEQTLMNGTTVRTEDYRVQGGVSLRYYTTSDKLYAPAGDPNRNDSNNIYVGSKNSKLVKDTYWSSGDSFWLRSPDYYTNYSSTSNLYAEPSAAVRTDRTNGSHSIRPASNINLSNVLFASAAPASTRDAQPESIANVSTYDITDDTMSLRLDGSKEGIGTVFYSSTDNAVTAIKGNTNKKVSLIIQGKTDDKDWYISETITGYYKLTLDKDVSQCKIWLEIPADDGSTLAYAVNATEHEHTYPETIDPTKSDYWNGHDGEYHWRWCTDEACPDRERSITADGKALHAKAGTLVTDNTDPTHHWEVCSICGEKITSTVKEHYLYNWKVDDTDSSKHIGTCKCGYTETEAHDFSVQMSDETYHWKECSKCGYIDPSSKEKHIYDDNGDCKDPDCNYNSKTHHDVEWVDEVEPTCEGVGYKEHAKCRTVGHQNEVFVESAVGTYVLSTWEAITIPAKGHTAGSTYKKLDDSYDAPVCTVCGEVITDKKEAHDFSKTNYDKTYHWKECSKCGHTQQESVETHTFDLDGICTMCGYNDPSKHTHRYDENSWEHDATYHWHICTMCGEKMDDTQEKHSYSGNKCTICGYVKPSDGSSSGGGSSIASSTVYVSTDSGVSGTWHQDARGWWFENTSGSYAKGTLKTNEDGTTTLYVAWVKTGSKWYAFDADGYTLKDWVYDAASSKWYYCDGDYGMHTGWLYTPSNGHWYYLDPTNGDMYASTTTPDGYLVGADGAYIPQ